MAEQKVACVESEVRVPYQKDTVPVLFSGKVERRRKVFDSRSAEGDADCQLVEW